MSFLGSAAGAFTGGIASIIGGALSNSAARHAATVANQRNIYNYQHRYQWAVEDMQKAGLNPILAATQGIGGSVNGASALSANYNLGEGVTAGMSAQAAGNSAKAAQHQANVAEDVGKGTVRKLDSDVALNAASAANLQAETAGRNLANKLAKDSYNTNLALYKQNLANAEKQGLLIDQQTQNAIYQRDVIMPAQAAMMTAQGNAANSSAAYNNQLSNVAAADYDYKVSRNKDYKNLGLSDDGLPWNTVGRAANRLFEGISGFFK